MKHFSTTGALELWGGVECTLNRVNDRYYCQLTRSGHFERMDDLEKFAGLGISKLRYPILWERTAPDGIEHANWSWSDEQLSALRNLDVDPIVGLVHHGSGPVHTRLTEASFVDSLATYAGAVAARYPWVEYYTPINEPLTTARFSGLYGCWFPHGRDEKQFGRALLHQCRAVACSMQAIRAINPRAKLVQTDDLSRTYSTPALNYQADFQNELRWLAWDLLCGRVARGHALWGWLRRDCELSEAELAWFLEHPCPPDIIGLNYYVTSERFLDERLERYADIEPGGNGRERYVDVEAVRVLRTPQIGAAARIMEAWERYRTPLAITEAHIDCTREDQLRWLNEVWSAAEYARAAGADIRAVTVWALLGAHDWNCLVTQARNYYEPGVFDIRGPQPRPTALSTLCREIAAGQTPTHPVLAGPGWWKREDRFRWTPISLPTVSRPVDETAAIPDAQPVLICGAGGTLGRAFARICAARGLEYRLMSRCDMDIADIDSVQRAFESYHPWAVVNAAGYVRVDDAERDAERCFRENTQGPAVLAEMCARYGVQLLTYSSDLVFDGRRNSPYVEKDPIGPLNVYGMSKAHAEATVLDRHPGALVIRTSAFFGPWDESNFIAVVLSTLERGARLSVADDLTVSPTYVPDLVQASLDLLIDRECGIWHLTNGSATTWAELAVQAATLSGVDASRLEPQHSNRMDLVARRPAYSALSSERGQLMPSLENALNRFLGQYESRHAEATRG